MDSSLLDGKLPYPNQNKGPRLLVAIWVLGSISVLVVLLRIYTKLRKTYRLYWDDVLMVIALLFGITYAATTTIAIHYGLGRHYLYLDQQDRSQSLKLGIVSMVWGIMASMFARISFCVTLLYLARTDPRVPTWPIWSFIAIQVVVNVAAVTAFYSQCGNDLSVFWTPSKQRLIPVQCWDPVIQTKLGYFAGSINCLTDAFLTVLPALLIEHTKLSLKNKIGLASLLCLSVVALVAAIVKTYAVKALSQVSDYTYDLAYYVIWMAVEQDVVITVTSIPLIRPLLKRRKRVVVETDQKWDAITLNSTFSRRGTTMRAASSSISSQENIVPYSREQYEMDVPHGITVTTEVSVTYEAKDAPFVHASLVGLVDGEVANPRLIKR